MVTLTLTELRVNLDKIVDEIIHTGVPVEIERRGHKIKIILADGSSKFDKLTYRPEVFKEDPESYVHCDWVHEWSESKGWLPRKHFF